MRAMIVRLRQPGGEVLLPAALAVGIQPVGVVDADLTKGSYTERLRQRPGLAAGGQGSASPGRENPRKRQDPAQVRPL